ncbi:MAG: ATP-binding protein, partial [Desulfobacterales bacterium]|nr:ATP-binding protein [Desulfobacterales bacterium]
MYPRFVEQQIKEALGDTRVVLLTGPRQAGKTTLVQRLAGENMPFFTLDNATTLDAAKRDPVGFIRNLDRAIIDEVQRVPELLLAIKENVDNDQRPGRFILTGSANLMTLPRIADSLAGRMEMVRLLPLSQGEIQGVKPTFLDNVLKGEVPAVRTPVFADKLLETVLAGGFPEAIKRKTWNRRQSWHLNYIDALIHRDVKDIAQIDKIQQLHALVQMVSHYNGQLVNYSGIGAPLDMSHTITRKYLGILEQLFLIHKLNPWYSNQLKRLTKTPKLHFVDTGLLAALQGISFDKLQTDRQLFGPMLETFILTELLKLASWSGDRLEFSHYRDKEKNEVDIIMRNRSGFIVGIEVKASATVTTADFKGLHKLAAAC